MVFTVYMYGMHIWNTWWHVSLCLAPKLPGDTMAPLRLIHVPHVRPMIAWRRCPHLHASRGINDDMATLCLTSVPPSLLPTILPLPHHSASRPPSVPPSLAAHDAAR